MIRYFFIVVWLSFYGLFCAAGVLDEGPAEPAISTDLHATGARGKLVPKDVAEWFIGLDLIQRESNNPSCIEVTELDQGSSKGLNADQIFFISLRSGCVKDSTIFHKTTSKRRKSQSSVGALNPDEPRTIFVLKHYKEDSVNTVRKELQQLAALKKTLTIKKFSSNFPRLVLNEELYKYPNAGRYASTIPYRYVGLIHVAKGYSLWDYIRSYVNSEGLQQEEYREILLEAFPKLGTVLANFHLMYMEGDTCAYNKRRISLDPTDIQSCKTKTHNDLHLKNIFWDGSVISFIDISTLVSDPAAYNFLYELSYFLATMIKFTNTLFDDETSADEQRKHALMIELGRAFITPYFSVFREKYREPLNYRKLVEKWKREAVWALNVISQDEDTVKVVFPEIVAGL